MNQAANPELASALRSSSEKVLGENELISSQKLLTEIFGTISGIGAVINKHRQIVYVNQDFLDMIGIQGIESILGNRPGEVLSCVHANNSTGGCSTADACRYCGAYNAIIESQDTGKRVIHEALITTKQKGNYRSLDLRIITTPVNLLGNDFLVMTLQDISNEKRRLALERIFFHDLLNRAGGLNGLLSLLKEDQSPETTSKIIDMSVEASKDIIEEIQSQRQMYAAETGDLKINPELTSTLNLIKSAIGKIGFHDSGRDRKITITEDSLDITLETDRSILQRVLINLLKNALEATPMNGEVLIGAYDFGNLVRFKVKNELLIPKDIQLQLFQRSFSTKGIGRGLGTYSIRLLTENYLGGSVTFISNETDRTIFMIDLPKKINS
ncbi:MAG TPA: sensor histidine kinase [Bacteroidales bacterium]|nr:sensor histidine kinase [Bacteroidales bacterium]